MDVPRFKRLAQGEYLRECSSGQTRVRMSISIVIRKYLESDREQCRCLWRELTEWHREIYQDATIGGEHPEDYFDKHLAKVGPDQLWVAEVGSKVVGLAGLIVGEHEAEIEPLIVSKTHRGKGIGKQLIETLVFESKKRRMHFLNIKPVARNIKTVKFLYKQGFTNLGYIELFMDLSEHSWNAGPKMFECEFNF
jgi:GNAT superfamily N-acetyltransferase